MAAPKKYDVVVFGASGFTGKFVVEELLVQKAAHPFKFAIGGRSGKKLAAVDKGRNLPIIIADVNDRQSMLLMCSQARVVLNCVGPVGLLRVFSH